jgi:hypothetical protein
MKGAPTQSKPAVSTKHDSDLQLRMVMVSPKGRSVASLNAHGGAGQWLSGNLSGVELTLAWPGALAARGKAKTNAST